MSVSHSTIQFAFVAKSIQREPTARHQDSLTNPSIPYPLSIHLLSLRPICLAILVRSLNAESKPSDDGVKEPGMTMSGQTIASVACKKISSVWQIGSKENAGLAILRPGRASVSLQHLEHCCLTVAVFWLTSNTGQKLEREHRSLEGDIEHQQRDTDRARRELDRLRRELDTEIQNEQARRALER